MTRSIWISIVAALALMINGVCLCSPAVPGCTAASCPAHEHHGTCPAHGDDQDSCAGHVCCEAAAYGSSTKIASDPDSLGENRLPPPVFARAPILDLSNAAVMLVAMREAHSPPVVPVFLAIRSLLL